jgi:proline racemase
MSVPAVEVRKFGPYEAVVPEVSGTASIIGRNEFYFDPEDPSREGFIFRKQREVSSFRILGYE